MAFLAPVILIIVGNIVAFCIVIRALLTSGNRVTAVRKTSGFKKARRGISIMVLLGLTWAFGILAIDDAKMTFQYLFCIFNTFQGLFVFIFFGILPVGTKAKVQNFIQKNFGALRRGKEENANEEITFNKFARCGDKQIAGVVGDVSPNGVKIHHRQSPLVGQPSKVCCTTRHGAFVDVEEPQRDLVILNKNAK